MNLEELRRIRDEERERDSLQHLPDEFYAEVGAYLADMRTRRDEAAAAASDPFENVDVRRLSDEVHTAERVVEAVYERRVGKIVKLASFEAADMAVERDGLTAEERELCEAIVTRIRANRERVLSSLDGGASEDVYVRGEDETEETSTPAGTPQTEEDGDAGGDPDRTTVRITKDVGEIVGVDERTYHLATDDVVSLPAKTAKPLVSRGAAEPIE